jgi:uncharacterized protein
MYSGELKVQAKRKTLAILQEGPNRILNLSRDLSVITDATLHDNKDEIRESSDKRNIIENDIMIFRKQIAREAGRYWKFYYIWGRPFENYIFW